MMSMGFLNPGDKPLIWRGPMLHSVIQQFLRGVDWGELDYLLIDLPPGTGDVQLTLIQSAPITRRGRGDHAIRRLARRWRKAVNMFNQVKVPILGIVENMSYLICPHCSELSMFSARAADMRTAATMDVNFLAELPLDPQCAKAATPGAPSRCGKAKESRFWSWRAGQPHEPPKYRK